MGKCGGCGRNRCVCTNLCNDYEDGQLILRTGPQGPAGSQGPTGHTGATGANGIAGAIGSQIYIGALANAPTAPPNNSIDVDPTTGILYQYSGVWSQRASIFGSTGPTGPARPINYGNITGTTSFTFSGPNQPQNLFSFSYTVSAIQPSLLNTTWSCVVIAPSGVNLTGYTYVDSTIYQTTITIPANLTGYSVPFNLSRIIIPSTGTHTVTTGFVPDGACTINLTGTNNDVTTYIL